MEPTSTVAVQAGRTSLGLDRDIAELHSQIEGLTAQLAVDAQIKAVLASRNEELKQQWAAERKQLSAMHANEMAAARRGLALRGLSLSRSRVEVHRWRQRSALLKVRHSSAEEDADRYDRTGASAAVLAAVGLAAAERSTLAACAASRRAAGLRTALRASERAVAEAQSSIKRLEGEKIQAREATRVAERDAAVERDRRALAEEVAASACGRAEAAEATLRTREELDAQRGQLAGLGASLEAGLAARGAADRELLLRETEARGAAERRAGAAEGESSSLRARVRDLEGQLERERTKSALLERSKATELDRAAAKIAELESTLLQERSRARAPSPAREVTKAMAVVGSLVDCLDAGLSEEEQEPVLAAKPRQAQASVPGPNHVKDTADASGAVAPRRPTAKDVGPPAKKKTQGGAGSRPVAVVPEVDEHEDVGVSTAKSATGIEPAKSNEPASDLPSASVAALVPNEPVANDNGNPEVVEPGNVDPSPVQSPIRRPRPLGRRAAGQTKANLAASVWGEDDTPGPLHRQDAGPRAAAKRGRGGPKRRQGGNIPPPEAGDAGKENAGSGASEPIVAEAATRGVEPAAAASTDGTAAGSQAIDGDAGSVLRPNWPDNCPLGALNPRVVAAAAPLASKPVKAGRHPSLERTAAQPAPLVAPRPAGGTLGKRPLLNVSAGEILAPSALFGANFKVPRLAKK